MVRSSGAEACCSDRSKYEAMSGVGRHLLDQGGSDLPGVQVVEAEPPQPFDIGDEPEQFGDPARGVDVATVGGEVLGHEDDLPDAARGESCDLVANVDRRPGALLAPKQRDRTEGARLVTPFCDLDVGKRRGRSGSLDLIQDVHV